MESELSKGTWSKSGDGWKGRRDQNDGDKSEGNGSRLIQLVRSDSSFHFLFYYSLRINDFESSLREEEKVRMIP